MPKELKAFTKEEVSSHNKLGDLWIIVDNKVYDVSKFSKMHPGGQSIFLNVAGKGVDKQGKEVVLDATQAFYQFHKTEVLEKYHSKLCIGFIAETSGGSKVGKRWNPSSTDGSNPFNIGSNEGKPLSRAEYTKLFGMDCATVPADKLLQHPLISRCPFGEQAGLKQYYNSPYYKESHLRFRLAMREFFATIKNESEEAEEAAGAAYPTKEMFLRMGAEGILCCKIGVMGMKYAKKFNIGLPGGLSPEDFDFHHELIAHEESARGGTPGYSDGLFAGFAIGCPPLINFYHAADQEEILKEVLLGQKKVCLAITGPEAGSDVANHTCIAKLDAGKENWIVRGTKKWITDGCFCDYFVTAVRTGDENDKKTKGMKGISLLLIKREDGLETKQISTSYAKAAGTALVCYEDAKVPTSRLMGALNKGFQCIMLNFNHERWMIAANILGFQRLILQECLLWLTQRQAFGRPLTDQPVLRFKFGQMCAAVECLQQYMDFVTYNMGIYYKRMAEDPKKWVTRDYLAGEIGLLKYQCTRVSNLLADNGCQLLGGRAVTRTGMGKYMERFNRVYKIFSIYGGSEEIMADLGVRQALREWKKEDKERAKL